MMQDLNERTSHLTEGEGEQNFPDEKVIGQLGIFLMCYLFLDCSTLVSILGLVWFLCLMAYQAL